MNDFEKYTAVGSFIANVFVVVSVVAILAAIGTAIWAYGDAKSRAKNGTAAAMMVLFSGFAGLPIFVIVICGWILIRPSKAPKKSSALGRDELPDKLDAVFSPAESSDDFFSNLSDQQQD